MDNREYKNEIIEYSKDWVEDKEPYLQWEYKFETGEEWVPLLSHPTWDIEYEYRRVVNVIRVNEKLVYEGDVHIKYSQV